MAYDIISTGFHLSASAIQSFKACPTRFRLNYREGLQAVEDTDAQRVGTNWHAIHEVYHTTLSKERARLHAEGAGQRSDDTLQEEAEELARAAVVDHLNQFYADNPPPASKTCEEWEIERDILNVSFTAYLWYWADDPFREVASEVEFHLPVYDPRLGLPLPLDEVARVGHIDHIAQWNGRVVNVERKSTSRSVAPDSAYWERLRKDTQVSMYALAVRDIIETEGLVAGFGIDPERTDLADMDWGNTLYDVWHKPTIKPRNLTQAATAEFVGSGEYCGQTFLLESGPDGTVAAVDGVPITFIDGKRGVAMRETPAMFSARLLEDMTSRPEFYFARKEIARTDADLRKFRQELFNIYQAQKMYERTGCWYENEQQCRATFTCTYVGVCYGVGADAVCDGKTTPPGFRRVPTSLTVEGAPADAE